MYRILSPNGQLFLGEKIIPIIEKVFEINGEKKRVVVVANGFANEPNGIVIYSSSEPNYMCNKNNFYIGNLRPLEVQKIMRTLVKEGYYDFSEMEYQNVKTLGKVTFDNGESLPYSSEVVESSFPAGLYFNGDNVFERDCNLMDISIDEDNEEDEEFIKTIFG